MYSIQSMPSAIQTCPETNMGSGNWS